MISSLTLNDALRAKFIASLFLLIFVSFSSLHAQCDLVKGETLTFAGGDTERTILVDGNDDFLSFETTVDAAANGHDFTYVVTDANRNILGIPPGNMVNFEPAGLGTCIVYGLSYTGNLNIAMGDNLFSGNDLSDACFDLSQNRLLVNRIAPQSTENTLFASSNTSGKIGVFDILTDGNVLQSSFDVSATDADGIYYDADSDVLYQLNRTDNVINAYSNVSTNPTLTATSSSDFSNGREIAVAGNKLVVAQDAAASNGDQNQLLVYNISPTSITLDKVHDVSINLWGIHANGNELFAIVDNSSDIVFFENFFNQPAGMINVSVANRISIENMVRTHGLTYDPADDVMYLTDVGEASSATDGAIIMVENWTAARADRTVSASEQGRAFGAASLLGNPVDIAIDKVNRMVYVAERANGGGRILGFKMPLLTGGIRPAYKRLFAGASAVQLPGTEVDLDICDFVDGGTVSFPDGNTETTIIVDGNADMLSFNSTVNPSGHSFTYVVTDADNMILGIPPGNEVDFDPAGLGSCLVYGLSYSGNLNIAMGDNLMGGQDLSTDCFDLSSNKLVVNRVDGGMLDARFFVSSNTSGTLGIFNVFGGNVQSNTTNIGATDADGVFYDEMNDVLYHLNRTDKRVDLYTTPITNPTLAASSTSDFTNGREIAVFDGKLVVADDVTGANKLVVYDITPTSITFDKTYDVGINLWGIQANGNQLIAIVDNSADVAIFNNFFDQPAGTLMPDMTVTIENMIRTHGLKYIASKDMMFLTDVGAASSAGDGAFFRIRNWSDAIADGMVSTSEQIKISGGTSMLGNPVDIDYDMGSDMVFIAERANGGGRVLGFKNPRLTGGARPVYNYLFAGAAGIHLPGSDVTRCDVVNGGTVAFTDGNTRTTIFVDGTDDFLSFSSTVDAAANGHSFTYVVTDADNMILGIPPGNMVNFDPAGLGSCLVYGLSYTGNLNIAMGDDLMGGQNLSDDCFSLSSNNLVVNRIEPGNSDGNLYASSNTQANIGVFDIQSSGDIVPSMIGTGNMDSDGIHYDKLRDQLYQLDRTNNVVNLYSNASTNPTLTAMSTSDFTNGREIAVSSTKLVVAQDAATSNGDLNKLIIYDIDGSSITLDKVYDVSINLWGIHLDGDRLIAIVDNSAEVAIFDNFFANAAGSISASQTITVENMIRTHGLAYDAGNDMLILTDVGAASSATDGALVVVRNFADMSADDMISASEQARVFGASSFLGNPVDVALDKDNGRVYVAERANGGGRILGFKTPNLTGGIAPTYNRLFAGASAVNISTSSCDFVIGGMIRFRDGTLTKTIGVGDGAADLLYFKSNLAPNSNVSQTFVVTDATGKVLGIPPSNMVNFEGAGVGVCNVYNLSYSGNLLLAMDDNINTDPLSDECAKLSTNFLTVIRIQTKPNETVTDRSGEQTTLGLSKLYPNPVRNQLNVVVESDFENDGLINILNMNGAVVLQKDTRFYEGENTVRIEVGNLPQGVYFLQIPGMDSVTKFVKSNR